MTAYVLTTERLGLRDWVESDRDLFADLNRDERVMKYFPRRPTREASDAGIDRFRKSFQTHGFTYFAVDELASGTWIGFIGLLHQDYDSPWTPFVDIGWRLTPSAWGRGLATEGAKACLALAQQRQLNQIYATAPWCNAPSIGVMKKIGMQFVGEFIHPAFDSQHTLQPMHAYRIDLDPPSVPPTDN